VKEVAEQDPYVSRRVEGLPDGIIALRVADNDGLESRISKPHRSFTVVDKSDGRKPNAVLTFASTKTAYDLLKGNINAMTALGTTEVSISGRIPMIQDLFPILDRFGYLMSRQR